MSRFLRRSRESDVYVTYLCHWSLLGEVLWGGSVMQFCSKPWRTKRLAHMCLPFLVVKSDTKWRCVPSRIHLFNSWGISFTWWNKLESELELCTPSLVTILRSATTVNVSPSKTWKKLIVLSKTKSLANVQQFCFVTWISQWTYCYAYCLCCCKMGMLQNRWDEVWY